MSLITVWGYTIEKADELPPIITEDEFNEMTAGKFNGDVRTPSMIAAASTAVRNFVGWHLFPSLECKMTGFVGLSPAFTRTGCEILVQLPAKLVTSIVSVKIDGNTIDSDLCLLEPNGLLHIVETGASWRAKIEVVYVAGLPSELMGGIKELAANCATHALANSYGVTSEASGGVSITYNATWAASPRATALADDNKETLMPYKVKGVF